jgi:hypothetical protein
MLNEDENYANQEQSLETDKGTAKWLSASWCYCIELRSLFFTLLLCLKGSELTIVIYCIVLNLELTCSILNYD